MSSSSQPTPEHPSSTPPRQAAIRLHILIVGCGIGGLAAAYTLSRAGHKVTILESSSHIGEVGAGIQITPNVARLLARWGLPKERIGDPSETGGRAVRPSAVVLRRYECGSVVGETQWRWNVDREGTGDGEVKGEGYGGRKEWTYWHIHRADFHRLLVGLLNLRVQDSDSTRLDPPDARSETAQDDREVVALRLNSTVTDITISPTTQTATVTLSNGRTVTGDLVVGADGIKSVVQGIVLAGVGKVAKPPRPTGDAVYRAIIPTDVMLQDPELKPFVDRPEMTGWMGPKRHVMAYCIRAKKEYNIVLAHPDDGSVESWTAEGSADKMRSDFTDFEPRIRKMLSYVSSTLKWRLMDRDPLETWVHPSGRITLLGDACHPMLPYRAQGAAMAIEDAAVLGNLLSRITHISQLKPLLYAYETLRLPRATETQESSRLNQTIFHLEDGEEQRKRDDSMREAARQDKEREALEGQGEGSANQWADERKNEAQFGYDADQAADHWWAEVGEQEIGRLGDSANGQRLSRM
ncbi:FAD/NAD(P)-binding domain-containing protein [Irpex rosettiformis]|uniref:FAD/NAD(P)-binding domain-containing protein n=1 Tax=Irpex rosettiformis TaxID=378272 RepID=A0ACB8TTW6_9APHY|nr:FAD/NAD(P)-binding domain-containing protein [Irpex rosettiformis]